MKRVAFAATISLLVAANVVACGDDDAGPITPSFEAGTSIDGGANPSDGAPANDAGSDAGSDEDAGHDAGHDADAGPQENALFAHIAGTLVSIDPTTGAVTTVGPTAQTYMALAWDGVAKIARIVKNPYTPAGAATGTPQLGTIDLCTGTVTDGPALTLAGVPVRRAEGLAQDPSTGTFYIAFGTSGTSASTEFLSEKTGTVDIATGAITENGSHTTIQNDGDNAMFVGNTFKLLDVATSNNTGALYTIDKTTGAASAPVTTGPTLLRVTYDPTRSVVFTAVGAGAEPNVSNRSIGKLDLTTGTNTPLGPALGAGAYPTKHFNALVSAPAPVCP